MKHIIIGIRGQIGTCIKNYLMAVDEVEILGIDRNKDGVGEEVITVSDGEMVGGSKGEVVMHVCIPFIDGESFYNIVKNYMVRYCPKYVVIYSTVLPGTSEGLGDNVVHSPVEGRHPDLYGGFTTFRRLVGGKCSKEVGDMFRKWGMKDVVTYEDAKVTELGKILSTSRYGINLLFAAAEESLCKQYGVNFENVVLDYQRMYNEGYEKLGEKRFIQSLLTAPEGKIGGHCIVPNAKLLTLVTNHQWIKDLSEYNLKNT